MGVTGLVGNGGHSDKVCFGEGTYMIFPGMIETSHKFKFRTKSITKLIAWGLVGEANFN